MWSIDTVLMPVIPSVRTVGALLRDTPAPTFTAALQAAGLFSFVSGNMFRGTVFLPTEQVS